MVLSGFKFCISYRSGEWNVFVRPISHLSRLLGSLGQKPVLEKNTQLAFD